ncbi:MAG TPA: 3-hydroxyacyl-CoA dehydrogenase family protein [Ferruginibacter sp.]|nr:3-hydroxyacyl-CoA dehydrogenase family protein [Ferruginibacter sp.]
MTIAALHYEPWQWEFLKNNPGIAILPAQNIEMLFALQADAYMIFNVRKIIQITEMKKPVLLGCVTKSNKEMNVPDHVIRFNDWNGFLEKPKWEITGERSAAVIEILKHLGKEPVFCNDQPGFISARVIALIINEAYYALGEEVSTKKEIDTAMKLGTNYPYGPFEWCEKIGKERVYQLLNNLSKTDERYLPAPGLVKECML